MAPKTNLVYLTRNCETIPKQFFTARFTCNITVSNGCFIAIKKYCISLYKSSIWRVKRFGV